MHRGNFPPNPYQSSPPFSPSPGFLRPRGPRFWQPSVRCSTPAGDFSHSSPGHCPWPSPRGQEHSDPDYIPLNSSPDSSPVGNGWTTPKWRGRGFSPGPRDRYGQSPGFGRSRGRWDNKMNTSSPQRWESSPGQSANIQSYVSQSCLQDPWEELAVKQEDSPGAES